MIIRISVLFVLVFGAIKSERYSCENDYRPSDYVGKSRVPIRCFDYQLKCPTSWKSGIPKGSETSAPMIYDTFLTCHEGYTSCGYVPINKATGEVVGQNGVTIGAGVDLGNKSRASFPTVSNTILDKLEPYFGLKRKFAACAIVENPLRLRSTEADKLTDATTDEVVDKVSKQYDSDKEGNALPFVSLARGIRTAIVSVWFQFGSQQAYPKLWSFVTKNDWENAIKELRNFYKNPEKQAREDLRRRNNEADIIEANLLKCNRSVDVVFLLDESGSVGKADFIKSLDFVKNTIKAFPDNQRSTNDGARFGLSTFDDNYTSHFYLSNYTNRSAYFSAIDRVSYSGRGTKLGRALELTLPNQFNEERGMRPEADGILRILIVLTDAKSEDGVSIPAENLKDEGIVIYAIGINRYYLKYLEEIASSRANVYMLYTFTALEKFISTLTPSMCYEARPLSLNKAVSTNVAKGTYLYFSYKVKETAELVVKVTDLSGRTLVCASRTNPHPYKYDSDVCNELSNETDKVIVISARKTTSDVKFRRSINDGITRPIYVSVTSDTDSASFAMESDEHIPSSSPVWPDGMLPISHLLPTPQPHLPSPPLPPPPTSQPRTSGAPASEPSNGSSTSTMLIIALVATAVVVALVIFLLFRKTRKK